jgi:hypothetical protein
MKIMLSYSRFFLLCFILNGCSGKPQQEIETPLVVTVADAKKYHKKPAGDYAANKQKIVAVQRTLKGRYEAAQNDSSRQLVLAEAEKKLTQHLLKNIIPFWYGTAWNFNGYTAEPGKGTVACGYFVSTTLLHSGFKLNRYLLAQQGPRQEAITVNLSDTLITLMDTDREEVKKYFKEQNLSDGLYFVGLDFHVGYLLKEDDNLFFIHANYIGSEGVVIEPVDSSKAFKSYNYYIGRISSNKNLIRKWILNEPIEIYQGQ